MVAGIKIKSFGFWIIAIGGAYGAYFQDFKVGGIIFGLGALIVAIGDVL